MGARSPPCSAWLSACLPAGLLCRTSMHAGAAACMPVSCLLSFANCDAALERFWPCLRRNADILADPFGAGELWDRFEVAWQGELLPPDLLAGCFHADLPAGLPPTCLSALIRPCACPFACLLAAAVAPDGSLVEEQAENSMHCPWELYTPGTTHQAGTHTPAEAAPVPAPRRPDLWIATLTLAECCLILLLTVC